MQKITSVILLVFMAISMSGCITFAISEEYRITSKLGDKSATAVAVQSAAKISDKEADRTEYEKSLAYLGSAGIIRIHVEEESDRQASIRITEWHAREESDVMRSVRVDLETELLTFTNDFKIHKLNGFSLWRKLKQPQQPLSPSE